MKNLIDELHALNEEEFEVSASFSKNVMKKIKRKNNVVMFVRVASVLSCACLAGLFVFIANKNGLFSSRNVVSSLDAVSTSLNSPMAIEENVTQGSKMKNESFNSVSYDLDTYSQSEIVEESIDGVTNESLRTYSKQYSKEDYLEEISILLIENGYANQIVDNQLIIESDDINSVSYLLEKYIDVQLELKEDKLLLSIY